MTGMESSELRRVEAVLRRRIGLNAETVGPRLIPVAVETRMAACGVTSAQQYITRLHVDDDELAELIEEVVVPESWFFREISPFRCFRDFAQAWRSRNGTKRRMRVLSVPCSRGEEPYSMAMTLLDMAWTPEQFEILGVDLSRRSLHLARQGVYRAAAFREQDPEAVRLQRQFFRPHGADSELVEDVRRMVRFVQGNVVVWDFLREERTFDVIFCRNLVIYLGPESRQIALRHLRRLLAPGGLFYVGHTECRLAAETGFIPQGTDYPAAFTVPAASPATSLPRFTAGGARPGMNSGPERPPLRPAKAGLAASGAAAIGLAPAAGLSPPPRDRLADGTVPTKPLRGSGAEPRSGRPELPAAPSPPAPVPPPSAVGSAEASLAACRQAADAGRLSDAVTMCERLLAERGASAEAYCLLGVIRQAQGDLGAAEACFQRALYLAPDHHESLIHMGLLCQRRGDFAVAANYERRAQRARNTGGGR